MKFETMDNIQDFFNLTITEICEIKRRDKILNSVGEKLEPKEAAYWLLCSRLDLDSITDVLADSYIDQIEVGIFKKYEDVMKDYFSFKNRRARV